ncbi:MAG: choice-of-anchor D domain-containing protein [Alphaproteobacteria bacterium]|nr:choice-of-anchor D domain-containing protein [Alphaproteobacteria bacterium]
MVHRLRAGPLCGVLALAACDGGPDNNLNKLYPEIVVAPDTLELGEVVVPYSSSQELQVINAGRADLTISSIALAENTSRPAAFTVTPATATLGPDESVAVLVTFAPDTYVDYGTSLVIESDDPDRPLISVPILAEGIDGPVPELSIDTLALDFGEVDAFETEQAAFTITNSGTGPLEILDGSGQTGDDAFTLLSDPVGAVIEPGGSFPVIVQYEPDSTLGEWGQYKVVSNDPLEPELNVLFIGNGGGDYNYPVAIIEADTTAAPLDTLLLDGSSSYDPQGYEPLSYEWVLLDQPGVSTTRISDPSAAAPSMFLDAAGTYTALLTVENSIGLRSDTVAHSVAAIPVDDLYVIMSWNTGNSDLDLHLVQDDPDNYFESPEDCCFCNPNPRWGESGDADDPLLALDNRVGYGPENINIEDPVDGLYYIRVHYFIDNSGGPTEATVKIYVGGEEAATYSKVLTQNQVWDVAWVDTSDGSVIEDNADPYNSPHRECQ